MGLFEELSQSFPSEVVSPFGEVLIIPCKVFKTEWKPKLESEGVKIFVQAFKGESCFFLRKHSQNEADSQNKAEVEVQPLKWKPRKFPEWTEQELAYARKLRSEGLSYRKIAAKLNKSAHSVFKKLKELEKQNVTNMNDVDVVKEFLSAASVLYPSHKRACKLLLEQAAKSLE
ncbi:MAG: hypothetical protein ACPLYF_00085 [Fervidobacterium sp.]